MVLSVTSSGEGWWRAHGESVPALPFRTLGIALEFVIDLNVFGFSLPADLTVVQS